MDFEIGRGGFIGGPPGLKLRGIGDGRRCILAQIRDQEKAQVDEITLGKTQRIAKPGSGGMGRIISWKAARVLQKLGGIQRHIVRVVNR